METLASVLIGLMAGVFGGMFGVGGGIVMVPAMVYALHYSQHRAQGTSLAVLTLPVGFLGAINYYKSGNADWRAAAFIAAGFVGGSFLGSKYSLSLPEGTLRKVFAIFLVFVAAQMWFKPDKPKSAGEPTPAVESSSPQQSGG